MNLPVSLLVLTKSDPAAVRREIPKVKAGCGNPGKFRFSAFQRIKRGKDHLVLNLFAQYAWSDGHRGTTEGRIAFRGDADQRIDPHPLGVSSDRKHGLDRTSLHSGARQAAGSGLSLLHRPRQVEKPPTIRAEPSVSSFVGTGG